MQLLYLSRSFSHFWPDFAGFFFFLLSPGSYTFYSTSFVNLIGKAWGLNSRFFLVYDYKILHKLNTKERWISKDALAKSIHNIRSIHCSRYARCSSCSRSLGFGRDDISITQNGCILCALHNYKMICNGMEENLLQNSLQNVFQIFFIGFTS